MNGEARAGLSGGSRTPVALDGGNGELFGGEGRRDAAVACVDDVTNSGVVFGSVRNAKTFISVVLRRRRETNTH